MLFRKDYAFLQVIVGVLAFVVPLILILTLKTDVSYGRDYLMMFTVFGLVLGFASGFTILNAYYKLTERLKFMEYEDYKESKGKKE